MKGSAAALCAAALVAWPAVAAGATPPPDLDRIVEEQTTDQDRAYADIKARLRALRPDTPDDERLDAVLRATVAGILSSDQIATMAVKELSSAIALAERDGHLAAATLMKVLRAAPAADLLNAPAAQQPQRLAALGEAMREARAAGRGTGLCLALLHQNSQTMDAGRPLEEWAAPVFEAASMGAEAPRCTAVALGLLSSGFATMSREADGASGAWRLEKDLDYAAQALRLAPRERAPVTASLVLTYRGTRLVNGGRLEEGLNDCREAVALARAGNSVTQRSTALYCMGNALAKLNRAAEAVAVLREAGGLAASDVGPNFVVLANRGLAVACARLSPPDAACAEAALERARSALGGLAPEQSEFGRRWLKTSAEVHALLGQYRQAYEFGQQAAAADAAALGQQQSEAVADLSTRLDLQGKQAEIEKLALREAEATTRRNAFAIGLVLSVLALTVVVLLLRRQTRQKRQITALYTQLETLNADRSRFLAAACHDLRQPTYALSLLAEAATTSPERSPKYLADIRRNTLTLGDMLSELLDLTQLERGELHTAPGPVDLDALLAEAAAQYRSIAERRGLSMQVVPCGQWVFSDPYLLRRMVFNLVSNACKYTDRGGVQLDVLVADGTARIRVTDTGRGIPADRIDDMLRPYTRLDHGAAEEGLGIGLSVVQNAAQLLGHRLSIDSVVGRGTTVTIEVPLTAAPAPGVAAEPAADVPVRGLVALVDDSVEIREALAALLHEWGIDSVGAGSGAELLQRLHELGDPMPALLLTDYQLGVETGLDVVRALRARPGWDKLPAVMVTGSVSLEAEDAARDEGVTVLLKPARPARLRKAMARAVEAQAG